MCVERHAHLHRNKHCEKTKFKIQQRSCLLSKFIEPVFLIFWLYFSFVLSIFSDGTLSNCAFPEESPTIGYH